MDFIDQNLLHYVEKNSTPQSDLLARVEKETNSGVTDAHMLSGNLQGRWLSFLTKAIAPKTILEIGTYTGFSALCLVEGLQEGGHIDTLEISEKYASIAQEYFNHHGRGSDILIHKGNAREVLPTLDKEYDMVFIDADKENYLYYYQTVLPKVKIGGRILLDNTLWYGKVLDIDVVQNDRNTKSINDCNVYIRNDEKVECVILPLRDGITLVRKK